MKKLLNALLILALVPTISWSINKKSEGDQVVLSVTKKDIASTMIGFTAGVITTTLLVKNKSKGKSWIVFYNHSNNNTKHNTYYQTYTNTKTNNKGRLDKEFFLTEGTKSIMTGVSGAALGIFVTNLYNDYLAKKNQKKEVTNIEIEKSN